MSRHDCSSLASKRTTLWTGLHNSEVWVFKWTVHTNPFLSDSVLTTRPMGQTLLGQLSSFTRMTLLTATFRLRLFYLARCWRVRRYSLFQHVHYSLLGTVLSANTVSYRHLHIGKLLLKGVRCWFSLSEDCYNLVPRVSHLTTPGASEERPWFGLVTCVPESGTLQLNRWREGRLSRNFVYGIAEYVVTKINQERTWNFANTEENLSIIW